MRGLRLPRRGAAGADTALVARAGPSGADPVTSGPVTSGPRADGPADLAAPLPPAVVTRLGPHRLATVSRVTGTREGAHRSTRHGHSLEFADQRPYVAGDDPRSLDLAASRRHGRLLVRIHEAEDDTSLRVVLDASRSMAFGGKLGMAGQVARALGHVAAHGGDRIRVVVATEDGRVTASPWMRGAATGWTIGHTLAAVPTAAPSPDDQPGPAALLDAIRRARGEGPAGPVVLVSDLLVLDWTEVVRALATGRGDAVLVHLLGREDRAPDLDGDVDLVDAETGQVVSIAATDEVLAAHTRALARWQDEVQRHAARHGVAVVAADDRDQVDEIVTVGLRRTGVVA